MSSPKGPAPIVSTRVKWLILIIASIGFAFDIYELLMLPLILRPALMELVAKEAVPGTPQFYFWSGMLFYLPAFAGGIFGLWGGYLTDRLGRRRVLTWSILLYAFSAFFAGFSTNMYMLLFFRCTTFIGVCVEFVAAVAWLAELFPDPVQREKALGYTQAFSSIGGLMVAVASGIASRYSAHWWPVGIPGVWEVQDPHAAWRYTLMSGLIPAIPLIIIRPFLPESPVWAQRRQAGTLKRPSITALFAPEFRKQTVFTAIGFACSLGIAFGAIQQMPQIVPGLAEVREDAGRAREKAVAKAKSEGETSEEKLAAVGRAAAGRTAQLMASEYTKMQEFGGLVGRFVMAAVLASGLAWGWKLRMFQLPGVIITAVLFYYFVRAENAHFFSIPLESVYLGTIPVTTMSIGMFLMGFFIVAQLSFWGNYLPHMYPVHLRGTGESFAANIGGRMTGVLAAAVTSALASALGGIYKTESPALETALEVSTAAAVVGTTIAVIGFIASFFLPEPSGEIEHH